MMPLLYCAERLKVLAHPTRLAILDSLKDETKCVNDVCELLSVPQPNLSQHLSILRREGLVGFTEDGKKRCYYLKNQDFMKALVDVLSRNDEREPHTPPTCCSEGEK